MVREMQFSGNFGVATEVGGVTLNSGNVPPLNLILIKQRDKNNRLILAAGLFVFASVLNDSFSPVVHQSVDGGDDDTNDNDDGFGGELRSEYDYRYGWSFVACSLAFLTSEASAVFTITAYFRRLEDHVQYTAVDRKPSPDTPPSAAGDRSSACSTDARADSPDGGPSSGAAAATEITSRSSDHHLQSAAGRHHQAPCANGGTGDCSQTAGGAPSSGVPATADACNGTASKTPPDICPPKIGCDDAAAATVSVAVPPPSATRLQSAASYCAATLNHHPSSAHSRHHQHYRQTLAVGGNGSCYEVDTTKPCTCGSAATTTTKRYATIAGVARHNGGKLQYTTTTTALTTAAASNNSCSNSNGSGGGNKRLQVTGRSAAGGAALSAIKETVGGPADHHHLQHHVQHQQQQQQQQQHHHHHHHHATTASLHHRKPEPPTRRLKASVGGYVVPQTPIAALEALDCPPAADPRLVLPSSV
ncbi:Hypothetical protein CINCED_3A012783 [Cinara cedri]|uniref:Uncharacterized protein n=1 Tax=Cinara cedri TaxID=506608 RepID=A0A5E4M442_9HEMI|nr:Hypothetical protein CINCED_3A012783 [Cinara cedri]